MEHDSSAGPWGPEWPGYAVERVRAVVARLRLFSWVMPRPKEAEGDSLQIAFTVADAPVGRALLARLGLSTGHQLVTQGPFTGASVYAWVSPAPADHNGDPRWGHPIAGIRLWNDESPYEITPSLVDQAVLVEQRLVALAADTWPRETDLLSWITPDDL